MLGVEIMKIGNSLLILIFFLSLSTFLSAQQETQGGGAQAQGGEAKKDSVDLDGQGLYMESLEDFEDAEDWYAKATSPVGATKTIKLVQMGEIRSTGDENSSPATEESYSLAQSPENPNHVLGIRTHFEDEGFDRVEIGPPHEMVIRGKARQFSVWVLGRNFRHSLFVKLRDYRGKVHKLRMGRLNFFGWRKLTVVVPGWLPQSTRFALLNRHLHFVSLFVVSDYHEPKGGFYFYVDGLKALVDRGEGEYPGSEIRDNW